LHIDGNAGERLGPEAAFMESEKALHIIMAQFGALNRDFILHILD
jgi:hypothetical protein